jgi:hypothetical protein
MKNWLHIHLPKVTKTALGPLGVKLVVIGCSTLQTNLHVQLLDYKTPFKMLQSLSVLH